ncbi:imidazole glycerol phosphate synthase subunit HisF [Castellaniella denitrificans]|uniref:imidazole glycerol-phosphate synthase n=1 Tax=Castellaniella denitrificans TaxID=56119 RepID=A0ABT4LZS5_9BURK|nr:imidazole glycerol phosphate synthase cyclase subunit [Castellaniella denitrificans]MCZ4328562.1 imidazole glycerol phosphate synthase cyclase subunit [Castellaniella denitrificans]
MLKVRVIPTLLWKQFGLVKGVGFDSWRRVGSVLPAMRVYAAREVDELILVDITAHQAGNDLDFDSIEDFSQDCHVPLTIGGGVRHLDQVAALLRVGADKISINTAAYDYPQLISQIARRHGVQCIVASIDVRVDSGGDWKCFSHAGTQPTGLCAVKWARQLEAMGAGEILITSIDRDGTMAGYDLGLIEAIASSVNIPIIASGGAGSYQHMVDAVIQGGAAAVAAASMFHFTEQTPAGAKRALAEAGIPVRWPLDVIDSTG